MLPVTPGNRTTFPLEEMKVDVERVVKSNGWVFTIEDLKTFADLAVEKSRERKAECNGAKYADAETGCRQFLINHLMKCLKCHAAHARKITEAIVFKGSVEDFDPDPNTRFGERQAPKKKNRNIVKSKRVRN